MLRRSGQINTCRDEIEGRICSSTFCRSCEAASFTACTDLRTRLQQGHPRANQSRAKPRVESERGQNSVWGGHLARARNGQRTLVE